jgi:hypothetical protein
MSFKKLLYITFCVILIIAAIVIAAFFLYTSSPIDDNNDTGDIILKPPEVIVSGTILGIEFVRNDTLMVLGEPTDGQIWNVSFKERSNVNVFIKKDNNINLPVNEFTYIKGYYLTFESEPKQIIVVNSIT